MRRVYFEAERRRLICGRIHAVQTDSGPTTRAGTGTGTYCETVPSSVSRARSARKYGHYSVWKAADRLVRIGKGGPVPPFLIMVEYRCKRATHGSTDDDRASSSATSSAGHAVF